MAEEEALGGESDLWVSSRGSEVVPEACSKKGIQGKSQLPTRRTSTSQAGYRADISWHPVLPTVWDWPGLMAVRPLPQPHLSSVLIALCGSRLGASAFAIPSS